MATVVSISIYRAHLICNLVLKLMSFYAVFFVIETFELAATWNLRLDFLRIQCFFLVLIG
uniref:Uncharacterized protein n=1 Tax=Arundo donax TaxID=35708 RepID=A0A0A9BZN9_ARUDO